MEEFIKGLDENDILRYTFNQRVIVVCFEGGTATLI